MRWIRVPVYPKPSLKQTRSGTKGKVDAFSAESRDTSLALARRRLRALQRIPWLKSPPRPRDPMTNQKCKVRRRLSHRKVYVTTSRIYRPMNINKWWKHGGG
jgi:hypothetical protein